MEPPYDLLAAFLGARADRARGIVARWRRAGYAASGWLGPGPAWCWLTRSGLAVTGQHYPPAKPPPNRIPCRPFVPNVCGGLVRKIVPAILAW
jgi:hypothetical protein